jgi:hypothetical protein
MSLPILKSSQTHEGAAEAAVSRKKGSGDGAEIGEVMDPEMCKDEPMVLL